MKKCYKSEAVAKSYAQMKQDELNKAKIIAGPGNKEEPGKVLADLPTDSPSEPKGQLKVADASNEKPSVTETKYGHDKAYVSKLTHASKAIEFDYQGDLGSRMRNGTKHWNSKDHLKVANQLKESAKNPNRDNTLRHRDLAESYEHEFLAQEKSKKNPKNKMNKSEPTLEKGIIKDAVLGAALTTTIAAAGIAHEQHNKAIDPHMTAPTPVEYDGNDPHIIVHSEEIHENKAKKIEALRQKLTEMRNAKPEMAKPEKQESQCAYCGATHGGPMEKCEKSLIGKSFNQMKELEKGAKFDPSEQLKDHKTGAYNASKQGVHVRHAAPSAASEAIQAKSPELKTAVTQHQRGEMKAAVGEAKERALQTTKMKYQDRSGMGKSELDKNLAVAPSAPSDNHSNKKPKAPAAPNPHMTPSKPAAPATHFDKPKANKPLAKAIKDANSCGQGFDADHTKNPHHETLIDAGFSYSHSTPVTHLNGEKINHHTYKRADRSISVYQKDGNWHWNGSARPGSGHHYAGKGEDKLNRYIHNMKKSESNPDSKSDAELGEKVEELVEQHMVENKEAEEKEGHKLTIKKGMSYNQLKEKETK
jgi:hypothetical protein